MCYNIIRKIDKGGNKMKKLNDDLAKRFYDLCNDIKNAQYSEDLFFRVGVASGFASGLFFIKCY